MTVDLFASDETEILKLDPSPAEQEQWVELKTELSSFDEFLLQSKLVEVQIIQDQVLDGRRPQNPDEAERTQGVKYHFTLAEYQQAQLETWIVGGQVFRVDKKSGSEELMDISNPEVLKKISIPFRRILQSRIRELQTAVREKKGYSLEIPGAEDEMTTTTMDGTMDSGTLQLVSPANGEGQSVEQNAV